MRSVGYGFFEGRGGGTPEVDESLRISRLILMLQAA